MKIENIEEKANLLYGPTGKFTFSAIVTQATIDEINALNKHHRVLAMCAEQTGDCVMAFHVITGNPFEGVENA